MPLMLNWLQLEEAIAAYLGPPHRRWRVRTGPVEQLDAARMAQGDQAEILVEMPRGSWPQSSNRRTHAYFEGEIVVTLLCASYAREAEDASSVTARRLNELLEEVQGLLQRGLLADYGLPSGIVSQLWLSEVSREWGPLQGEAVTQSVRFTIRFRTVEAAPGERGRAARTIVVDIG